MNIAELQAFGYFFMTVFLVVGLYSYIYHLYMKKEDADGIDYERYSNMALMDDVADTPVNAKFHDKKYRKGIKKIGEIYE